MPDHLKKHGNMCHSAGPRKVPRWEAGNRVTVGASERSSPPRRTRDGSAALHSSTSRGSGRRWEEGGWAVTSLTCFPLHQGTATPPRPWRCGGFNQEAASRRWRPAWRAPRGGGASSPRRGNRLRAKGRQVTRRDRDGRRGSISPLRHRCVRAERWQSSSVPRGSWC